MNSVMLAQRGSLKQALIDRARAGDRRAAEDLLTVCLDDVKRKISLFYGHGLEFEDLYQEAACAMWRALPKALELESPCAYLSGVAVNAVKWLCLEQRPYAATSSLEELHDVNIYSYIHSRGEYSEVLRAWVDTLLNALPEEDAQVLRLRYGLAEEGQEGILSCKDVAFALGCSVDVVAYRERRALFALQRMGGAA